MHFSNNYRISSCINNSPACNYNITASDFSTARGLQLFILVKLYLVHYGAHTGVKRRILCE